MSEARSGALPRPDRFEHGDEILERAARGEVAFEDFVHLPVILDPFPRHLYVLDERTTRASAPYRFLGIALLVLALIVFVVLLGGRGLSGTTGTMVTVAVLAGAALLIRRGDGPVERVEVPLIWVNGASGVIRLRQRPDQEELVGSEDLPFEEVREVIYSVRKTQLPGARRRTLVDGAGVFLRMEDGRVWPVIPATLEQERAYAVARRVASAVGVGVKQVGREWADG